MKGHPIKTDSLTQNDIDKIAGLLDKRISPLATKEHVDQAVTASEKRLKEYIDEGIDTVMDGIDNVAGLLAEKERVDKIELWARAVGEKIGVKLKI